MWVRGRFTSNVHGDLNKLGVLLQRKTTFEEAMRKRVLPLRAFNSCYSETPSRQLLNPSQ
ncbi:hypothetical protein AWB70_05723 [Caballeronia cordobensis]|uniref:Uncharacterized protein n=1 Tax=Caballeronia cordobensis TaxID=1353886 RepID=A0A158J2M6_CABCO|nr:hypothetical protein AWB70_05723 [Caballeronia cordobensis]